MVKEFNDEEKLRIENILQTAGERVSDSLSMMINQPVKTEIINFHKNIDGLESGQDKNNVVLIYTELKNGEEGYAFFSLDHKSALKLANIMLMRDENEEVQELDEDELDALKEAGNIVIGNFLSVVADFFKMEILFDPPEVIENCGNGDYGGFLSNPEDADSSLIADLILSAKGVGINGRYILIPSKKLTEDFHSFFE